MSKIGVAGGGVIHLFEYRHNLPETVAVYKSEFLCYLRNYGILNNSENSYQLVRMMDFVSSDGIII